MKISVIITALLFGSFATDSAFAVTSRESTASVVECSKEADAKGLHGKERKKFIAECRKSANWM